MKPGPIRVQTRPVLDVKTSDLQGIYPKAHTGFEPEIPICHTLSHTVSGGNESPGFPGLFHSQGPTFCRRLFQAVTARKRLSGSKVGPKWVQT